MRNIDEPLRQFRELIEKLQLVPRESEHVQYAARKELMEWAETWIKAYVELDDRLRLKEGGVPKDLQCLQDAGMNDQEIEALDAVTEAATRIFALPKLHPMDDEETCHDIHGLQGRLMSRPAMRALGWPEKDD